MQTMYVRLKLILLIGMESFSIYCYYYDTHTHARTTIDHRPPTTIYAAYSSIRHSTFCSNSDCVHPPSSISLITHYAEAHMTILTMHETYSIHIYYVGRGTTAVACWPIREKKIWFFLSYELNALHLPHPPHPFSLSLCPSVSRRMCCINSNHNNLSNRFVSSFMSMQWRNIQNATNSSEAGRHRASACSKKMIQLFVTLSNTVTTTNFP